MPSERAIPTKLNSGRPRTPYERPVQPSTPKNTGRVGAATPSSIFSRVKGFLTPKIWSKRESDHYEDDKDITMDEDMSRDYSSDNVFNFPPPSIPRPNLDRYNEYEQSNSKRGSPAATPTASNPSGYSGSPFTDASSPNQRLADFFKSKGDAKLTDMEAEGVLSLIRQASARNESLVELNNESLFDKFGENPTTLAASDSTPMKKTNSSPRIPVNVTSPYSPLYGQRKAGRDIQTVSSTQQIQTPSTLHFNSIPTPYRPSSRGPIDRSRSTSVVSDSKIRSPQLDESHTPEIIEKPEVKKPLSQTASALLSLLGTNEPETPIQHVPTEVQPFINPYASTPRSSPKARPRKSLVANHSTPKKVSAVAELERTKPSGSVKSYKPVRSSNLRQSNVPSPDSKAHESVKKQEEDVITFDFKSPKAQGSSKPAPSFAFSSPVKSSSHLVSPNKPLFVHTPAEQQTPTVKAADVKTDSLMGLGNLPKTSLFTSAPIDSKEKKANPRLLSESIPDAAGASPEHSVAQPFEHIATSSGTSGSQNHTIRPTGIPTTKPPILSKESVSANLSLLNFEFPSINASSPSARVDQAEVERLKRNVFRF